MAVSCEVLRVETAGDGLAVDLIEGVRSMARTRGVDRSVAAALARGAVVGVPTTDADSTGVEECAEPPAQLAARARARARGRAGAGIEVTARLRAALVARSPNLRTTAVELSAGMGRPKGLPDVDDRPRRREITV